MTPYITRKNSKKNRNKNIKAVPSKEDVTALKSLLYKSGSRGYASAVLDFPNVENTLPLLPATDIYFAIQEIGLKDAIDIVAIASPEQFQAFFDLDIWIGDRIDLERGLTWLAVLCNLSTGPFHRIVKELDPELVGAFIAQSSRIVDISLEDEPDEFIEGPWRSPDSFYAVFPLDEEKIEEYRVTCSFLDKLYSVNLTLGKRALMIARWEPLAELEETSYRWASGRLQDLGFADYYEALQLYAPLNLSKLSIEEGQPDPPPVGHEDAPSLAVQKIMNPETPAADFFGACMDPIKDPKEKVRLGHGLARVANRLLAADLVESPDLAKAQEYAQMTRRYISLGLEYVCKGDPKLGPNAFGNLTMMRLFRVGYTLTHNLSKLVNTLRQQGRLSLAPHGTTLLDCPWDELAVALSQRKPELSRKFDSPPDEGTRSFANSTDIRHAASLVEDLAMQWPLLFDTMGISPALLTQEGLTDTSPNDPASVTLGDIFRTAFINYLCGLGLKAVPLSKGSLEQALDKLQDLDSTDGKSSKLINTAIEAITETAKANRRPLPPRLHRILEHWIDPLRNKPDKPMTMEGLTELVLTKRS